MKNPPEAKRELSPWTTEVVMRETQDPPPLWAIELKNGELRFFQTEEEAKLAQEEGEGR